MIIVMDKRMKTAQAAVRLGARYLVAWQLVRDRLVFPVRGRFGRLLVVAGAYLLAGVATLFAAATVMSTAALGIVSPSPLRVLLVWRIRAVPQRPLSSGSQSCGRVSLNTRPFYFLRVTEARCNRRPVRRARASSLLLPCPSVDSMAASGQKESPVGYFPAKPSYAKGVDHNRQGRQPFLRESGQRANQFQTRCDERALAAPQHPAGEQREHKDDS
jgi:hypothetical protein